MFQDSAPTAANDRHRMCRICLETVPESQPATDLFDSTNGFCGFQAPADAIMLLCNVELLPEEHTMPQWCCGPCLASVQAAFQIRALCQESDRQLRGLSTAIKLEEEETQEDVMLSMEVEMIPVTEDCDVLKEEPEDVVPMNDELWKFPPETSQNMESRKETRLVFAKEEETALVRWLQDMQRKGFAITKASIQQKIFDFLVESPSWLNAFVDSHPELQLTGPIPDTDSVTESYIRNWFHSINEFIAQENLFDVINDPSRVLLAHATYFYPRNQSSTIDLVSHVSNISVMSCVSASGMNFTPCMDLNDASLSKDMRQYFDQWCVIESSQDGSLSEPLFTQWIKKFVLGPLVNSNIKLPIIVFVEVGDTNTATFDTAEQCLKMGVVLVAVFPGASRFWGDRLTKNWAKCAEEFRKSRESFPMEQFAAVLKASIDRLYEKKTNQEGFRSAGLFPFDANAYDYSLCSKED